MRRLAAAAKTIRGLDRGGCALLLLPVMILLVTLPASGQGDLQVRFQNDYSGDSVEARYTGGMLTVVKQYGNGDVVNLSARISDLDFAGATTVEGGGLSHFFTTFTCKGNNSCVSKNVPRCRITPGCQNQQSDSIEIECTTLNECTAFLNALKEEQAPKRQDLGNSTPQRMPQAASTPVAQPAVQPQTPAASDLHDLLASNWLAIQPEWDELKQQPSGPTASQHQTHADPSQAAYPIAAFHVCSIRAGGGL